MQKNYTFREVLLMSENTILYVVLVTQGRDHISRDLMHHLQGREGKILALDRECNHWAEDLFIQDRTNVLGFVHGAYHAAESDPSKLPQMIGRCEEWMSTLRDPSKWDQS